MSSHENSYESGSPLRSWHPEDAEHLQRDVMGLEGPFFIAKDALIPDETTLRILAKTESEADTLVLRLMEEMWLLDSSETIEKAVEIIDAVAKDQATTAEPDVQQATQKIQMQEYIFEKVTSMGMFYRQKFWSSPDNNFARKTDKIRDLVTETKPHEEEYPLLEAAVKMSRMFPGVRNVDAECIVRLLVLDELRHYQ